MGAAAAGILDFGAIVMYGRSSIVVRLSDPAWWSAISNIVSST